MARTDDFLTRRDPDKITLLVCLLIVAVSTVKVVRVPTIVALLVGPVLLLGRNDILRIMLLHERPSKKKRRSGAIARGRGLYALA